MVRVKAEETSGSEAEVTVRISRANFQEFLREVRSLENVSIESIADGSRLLTDDDYDAKGHEKPSVKEEPTVVATEDNSFMDDPWSDDRIEDNESTSMSELVMTDCTVALKPLDNRLLQQYLGSSNRAGGKETGQTESLDNREISAKHEIRDEPVTDVFEGNVASNVEVISTDVEQASLPPPVPIRRLKAGSSIQEANWLSKYGSGNKLTKKTNSSGHKKSLEKKIFACDSCRKKFSSKASLQVHIKRKHQGIKEKICDECSYQCTTEALLTSHKASVHGGEWKFECPVQGCRFKAHQEVS